MAPIPIGAASDGRTPHALAELHGNHDIATRLLAAGAHDELSPLDRFVAACARGDRAGAAAMLERAAVAAGQLRPDHHLLLHRPAESGDARALETMLASGFDPDARDQDNVTPLHRAAMGGHPDAVRVLLAHGADVNALDGMFAASPLVWAVEGRSHAGAGADHVAVARMLIDAGCVAGVGAAARRTGPGAHARAADRPPARRARTGLNLVEASAPRERLFERRPRLGGLRERAFRIAVGVRPPDRWQVRRPPTRWHNLGLASWRTITEGIGMQRLIVLLSALVLVFTSAADSRRTALIAARPRPNRSGRCT